MITQAVTTHASVLTRAGRHATAAKVNGVKTLVYSDTPLAEGRRVQVDYVDGRYEVRS